MRALIGLFVVGIAGLAFAAQSYGACEMGLDGKLPPQFLTGRSGERLEFSLRWKGLPMARGDVEFNCASEGMDKFYRIRAEVASRALISWFWSVHEVVQSEISPLNFLAKRYLVERVGNNERRFSLTFDQINKRALFSSTSDNGLEEKLIPFETAYDPLSLLYYARFAQIESGEVKKLELLTGKRKYLVTFGISSREAIKVEAGRFEADKINADLIKLSSKGEKKGKTGHAVLWLSADKRRLPLKLELESIGGELTSFSLF